jgi:hypothetical protein
VESNSLVEALKTPQTHGVGVNCKFTQIRDILSDEEKEALDKAVDGIRQDAGMGKSKRFSASWLSKVLDSFGHYVSVSTVQRHVNKECSCERTVR